MAYELKMGSQVRQLPPQPTQQFVFTLTPHPNTLKREEF